VKPATEPAPGEIVETRTTRRVVPLSDPENGKTPELWPYLAAIAPHDWSRHIVYGYRTEPAPKVPIFKCSEAQLQMPNGQRIPIADEQELEFALLHNFGGGTFRILVKRGPQIITAGSISINAPARPITISADGQNGNGATVTPAGSSDAAQIAGKAIDAVAAQEMAGMRVGVEALNAAANLQAQAANVIRNFASNPNAASAQPSQSDQLMHMMMMKMMERMIDRMDAPAPTGFPGLNGDMVGRFFSTVIERGLNPPVATNGGSVSGVAAIAGVLPQVLSYGAQIAAEVRMKAEAERDTVIAARSPQPPQAQPPQPRPQVLPPSAPAPAPNPNGANNMGAPSIEFIETRIIQILQQPISADEAADAVLMYLHTTDGPEVKKGEGSVEQLAKLGENGLVQLFQFRPKLKPATGNMPRLLEFIRAFLKLYAEDQEGEQQPPAAPPLAN
jgi:hypothetical protein